MPLTGKIQTLFSDKEKTSPVFPRTVVSAIVDEDGNNFFESLDGNIIYLGEAAEDSSVEVINADTFGGQLPSYYASVDSVVKKSEFLNMVYPIGSIYMSINSTNPATLFGGTWERIKDTFLLSAGDTYNAGTIGGEATHTLTIDEMPRHNHIIQRTFGVDDNNFSGHIPDSVASNDTNDTVGVENTSPNVNSSYTGGSQPHNNMPPYLAVYMWRRTA